MKDLSKNYINGQWVDWSGDTIEVMESGTGESFAKVPAADRATMEQAIKAADTAFAGWSQTPLEQRIRVIEQLRAGLKERSDEIAEVVSREVGMPIKLAKGIQAGLPVTITSSYLEILPDYPFTEQAVTPRSSTPRWGGWLYHALELSAAPGDFESGAWLWPPVVRWCLSPAKSRPRARTYWQKSWTAPICPRERSTWSAVWVRRWVTR